MQTAIVVFDPSQIVREGQIISGPERIAQLEAEGLILLPYEMALHGRRGTRGYFRRSWGNGWEVEENASTRLCPAQLDVELGYPVLFWVACVVPTSEFPTGQFRILNDTSQGVQLAATLSAGDQLLVKLGHDHPHPQADGGWIIGGRLRLQIANPGIVPLSLYGLGRGLAVRWLAVSQAKTVESPAWLQGTA
jgi:hypothetical protein